MPQGGSSISEGDEGGPGQSETPVQGDAGLLETLREGGKRTQEESGKRGDRTAEDGL